MVSLTILTLLIAIAIIVGIILLLTCGAAIIPVIVFVVLDVLMAVGFVYLIVLLIRCIKR